MDWIRNESRFVGKDDSIFTYGKTCHKTRVLRLALKDNVPSRLSDDTVSCPEDWDEVLRTCATQRNELVTILAERSRSKEAVDRTALQHLPWDAQSWKAIRAAFFVHESVARMINRSWAAVFSRAYVKLGSLPSPAIVYNCRSSSRWSGDIALSMTYFPEKHVSYSIFYGCNDKVQQNLATRLSHAEDALLHPLLLPGLFAEEERERQRTRVRDQLHKLVIASKGLKERDLTWTSLTNKSAAESYEEKAVNTFEDTYELKGGLEAFKEQLEKMVVHADELNKGIFAPSDPFDLTASNGALSAASAVTSGLSEDEKETMRRSGDRIKERLQDIILDYNSEIRQCELIMEGMTLTTQMAHTRANMEIAVRTKDDSTQMRSIALLTMIFLPATFAATLFSMGFFEWQPDKGQDMVSPRIWIYAVVAGGLTLITVGLWYVLVVRKTYMKQVKANSPDDYDCEKGEKEY